MLFKASAPGSLMVLGEHAVLQNKPALVCAVNQRMFVSLQPRLDQTITIHSALGRYEVKLDQLAIQAPFQFVIAALLSLRASLTTGCDITIESEFSDTVGFGSSAAVTVAMLKVLAMWRNLTWSESDLIKQARGVVQAVQGLGSGADVAACVLGGLVAYQMEPFRAEKLPYLYPLRVIYSGYKTPTVAVVQAVRAFSDRYPFLVLSLMQAIGACAEQGIRCVEVQDEIGLAQVMTVQQSLMQALGVSTPLLNQIIAQLNEAGVMGAKISGSGLGDCVVGLGGGAALAWDAATGVREIAVSMSAQGVIGEKI